MNLSNEDEGLAAEFALGTLDATERNAAASRRQREPALDMEIADWEARLGALFEVGPERAPPVDLLSRIEARLAQAPAAVDLTAVLRTRLARWRAAASGAGIVAAGLAAALAFVVATPPTTPHQFVAVLQKSPDAPAFAMTVDIDKLAFTVRPVAAEAAPDKSYELWIIAPNAAPKSLGVIDAATGERRLGDGSAIVREATYAVTVEAKGGSTTGKPSGAPVFYGKLVPVGP